MYVRAVRGRNNERRLTKRYARDIKSEAQEQMIRTAVVFSMHHDSQWDAVRHEVSLTLHCGFLLFDLPDVRRRIDESGVLTSS